ncbi:MAG: cupin domain-containing protein [Streptosporangiales bacterium]|nr:cupin domain-containing protein [Streptosporangiales bacterium]
MSYSDGFGGGFETIPARGFVVAAGQGSALPGAGGEVLASAADTGGLFSLIRSHTPAGDVVPLHVHSGTDECFFVLEGRYDIVCGDDSFHAEPGSFVYLPRGVPHRYTVGESPAVKLILSVPGGIESYFTDMGSGADAEELTHRHGVTFLAG